MKKEVRKETRGKRHEVKRDKRQVIQKTLLWKQVKKNRRRKGGGRANNSEKE